MIRYGSKPLPLDKAGSASVEVGGFDPLHGVIDTLVATVKAGELDAQLATAAQERIKAFKRRNAPTHESRLMVSAYYRLEAGQR